MRVVVRNLEVFATNKAEGGEGELADPLFGLSSVAWGIHASVIRVGIGVVNSKAMCSFHDHIELYEVLWCSYI
jgi:hypothetical protein